MSFRGLQQHVYKRDVCTDLDELYMHMTVDNALLCGASTACTVCISVYNCTYTVRMRLRVAHAATTHTPLEPQHTTYAT
jgi:hypothetical protein